ncbi:TIGR02301 family protein [Rhodomicrobium sp. Az07]|uniref:TIGR02301 family protein n=1 Tax=Rhodomicrobium sp. Az07 TaxID=2839034 RepID=UPI001BE6CE98|nr:TIGR02301 family protein [Rhodomicrobium sp. Az07]MBT3070896.1 TIGR02301 family protein [Rhodomicrobium sp. Az07]
MMDMAGKRLKAAMAVALACAGLAAMQPAQAQFLDRLFQQQPPPQQRRAPPRQQPAPPPPPQLQQDAGQNRLGSEDRPYDPQLFRLAEIMGTLHYLRELCGGNEGQVWREHMRELVSSEGTSALRRAKLVEAFNRGYRDYARTYRTCTQPARVAIQRFMDQATTITDGLVANDK